MSRLAIGLAGAAILTHSTPPTAFADRIYLLPTAERVARNLQMFRRSRPNISEEDARELIAKTDFLAKLRKAMAPAPILTDRTGTYFNGYILDYIPGPRAGNPIDEKNHDRIIVQAHGANGTQQAPKPIVISSLKIHLIRHAVDTIKDFAWQLSDRHTLLDLPFGSDLHRQSLYAFVDPTQDLGLWRGKNFSYGKTPFEGRFTRLIRQGLPTPQHFMTRMQWERNAPNFLFPNTGMSRGLGAEFVLERFHPRHFIFALARAAQYPRTDQRVGQMAARAIGTICSFADADPSRLIGSLPAATVRAYLVGLACVESVGFTLYEAAEMMEGRLRRNQGFRSYQEFGAFKVDGRYRFKPLLRLIAQETVFRHFLGGLSDLPGNPLYVSTNSRLWRTSETLVGALMRLAWNRDVNGDFAAIRTLAQAAISRLIAFPAGESRDDYDEYLVDRRAFRASLAARGGKPDFWLLDRYCGLGWGHRDDTMPMADRLFVIADHYYSEEDRSGSLSAADRKKRDRFMRQIAMVVQNINDTDREEVALLNHVNELITEKRNAVRQIRATGGPLVRFLGDYDGLMENRVACPDAAPSP
jgi:hypothetical protein